MKRLPLSLCLIMLTLGASPAGAKDLGSATRQQNYLATQRYYSQLISGTPQLAELNLLMTMLPKGGDIHHHYTGAMYAETYLDWVGRQGFCVYRENDPQNKRQKYRIETANPGTPIPDCLTADAIRQDNQFYRALLQRWSDKDFDNHFHEQPAPDQQFFNTFGYFGPVSNYAMNEGLKMLKERAKAENLQYLETMLSSAPSTDKPDLAAPIDSLPPDADDVTVLAALQPFADFMASDESVKKKIADYANGVAAHAAGLDDADFTLRFQSYVSRNGQPSKVFSGLYAAFAAAQDSKLIVGVNIVGPENGIIAMRDYHLHMQMFRFLKQKFPGVRLSLHAGELALGMVPPEGLRSHIREAVEVAGAARIGHGIDVTHEDRPDQLLATLRERKIAIEVNLTSNAFILGILQQAHPVTVFMRHQVPFVISTDDAGVSRNNLSGEYLLFASRYKPSYAVLKQTVYNSIRYSFLTAEEKSVQTALLDQRFVHFEAAAARLARVPVKK
jgi:adenosine deaminase